MRKILYKTGRYIKINKNNILLRGILLFLSLIYFTSCSNLFNDDLLGLDWIKTGYGNIIFYKDSTYRSTPGLGDVGDFSYDKNLKKGFLKSRNGKVFYFYINNERDLVFKEMYVLKEFRGWEIEKNVVFSRKSAKLMFYRKSAK